MQNTNNESSTTQGCEFSQSDLTTITKDFFSNFDFIDLKKYTDNLLLGWIASSYFDYPDERDRCEIFTFFTNSLTYFSKIEKLNDLNKEISLDLFTTIINKDRVNSDVDVRKYLNRTLKWFLESHIADDNTVRNDVIYSVYALKLYFKDAYKIINKDLQSKAGAPC